MPVIISKPTPEVSAVIKSAFLFAEKIFNEDDIDYSILDAFLGNADFELTDKQIHQLSILLDQYRKSLIHKKQSTPKHLNGYQHACISLPIVSELLSFLNEDSYRPSDLEKKLYKKLFDLFKSEEYHVDFEMSEYQDQFPQIQLALNNLELAGVLFILYKSDTVITVELTPDYCYSFVEF